MSDFEELIACVGEGWQPIVREMHAKVLEIDPDLKVVQIKEKFGGLRYYYHSEHPYQSDVSNAITDLVARAEQKCEETCEFCGEPGENKAPHGWFKTLCEEHRAEVEERRRNMFKETE